MPHHPRDYGECSLNCRWFGALRLLPSARQRLPSKRNVYEVVWQVDPVVDREGYSYERPAIISWLRRDPTSPVTRNPLAVADLCVNRALKELITSALAGRTARRTGTSAPPAAVPAGAAATTSPRSPPTAFTYDTHRSLVVTRFGWSIVIVAVWRTAMHRLLSTLYLDLMWMRPAPPSIHR